MEICECHGRHIAARPKLKTKTPGEATPPVKTPEDTAHLVGEPKLGKLGKTADAAAYQALLGGFTNFSAQAIPALRELAERHRPEDVTHVLYHGGCLDGMTSAWAAWKALGDEATYIPVAYQSGVPDLPEDARVAVVDFSFPREQMLELKSRVADVVVLDHHDTAAENLKGMDDFVVIDQDRAGAGLTWHYFHPEEPLPALAAYAEDRDLWRFDLPLSAEVNKAMASHPMNLETWDSLEVETLKREGREIYSFLERQNLHLRDLVQWADIAGHRVPVVNSPVNVDELAEVVLEKYPAPFMATYYDNKDGERKWSLRARGDFEVNAIAKQFGGGGHKAAAGFKEGRIRKVRSDGPGRRGPAADPLVPNLGKETEAVERFAGQQVERVIRQVQTASLDGHTIPVVNTPLNIREVGRELMDRHPDAPFVGVYYDTASGDRHWSLFARKNADLDQIADRYHGQGSPRRAEFLEGRRRKVTAHPPKT